MRILFKIVTWIVLLAAVWLGGLAWFIGQIPKSASEPPQADAIVVLTGGALRLDYGLELLAQGNAEALFITGVGKGVRLGDVLQQASPLARQKIEQHKKQSMIFLGQEAENTIGNAEETLRWLKDRKYTSLLLVTSNYHMPRSLNEFTALLPSMRITPAPVFPSDFKLKTWWHDTYSRSLMFSEYHKFLASRMRLWILNTETTP